MLPPRIKCIIKAARNNNNRSIHTCCVAFCAGGETKEGMTRWLAAMGAWVRRRDQHAPVALLANGASGGLVAEAEHAGHQLLLASSAGGPGHVHHRRGALYATA